MVGNPTRPFRAGDPANVGHSCTGVVCDQISLRSCIDASNGHRCAPPKADAFNASIDSHVWALTLRVHVKT